MLQCKAVIKGIFSQATVHHVIDWCEYKG